MTKTLRAMTTPGLFALAGALLLCAPAGAAGAVSPLPASNYSVRPACAPPGPGEASCLELQLVPRTAEARAHTHPLGMTRSTPIRAVSAAEGSFGLRPQDLHSAYQLPLVAPSAQTIALVDAYNDPNAEADLEAYDHEFGLPECTTGNGCLRQVNQNGETGSPSLPFPQTREALEEEEAACEKTKAGESSEEREAREAACGEVEEAKGWAGEMSLDIEVAHATCQNCHIVLVEASSPLYADFEAAEQTAAVKLNATEISNSWGGRPFADSNAFNHPGTVITASSGDSGYFNWGAKNSSERGYAVYPASSPHVVAVGGTRLSVGIGGTWAGETVWNGQGASGGGCSAAFPAQPWQSSVSDWSSVGCGAHRAVADVSADADPYTGVAVYDSNFECEYEQAGVKHVTHWCTVGGTSLSSPLVASTFALGGGAAGVAYPAKTLYENALKTPGSLHDVSSGSNGACSKPPKPGGLSGCTVAEEEVSCSSFLICLAGPATTVRPGWAPPMASRPSRPVAKKARKKPPKKNPNPQSKARKAAKKANPATAARPPAARPRSPPASPPSSSPGFA